MSAFLRVLCVLSVAASALAQDPLAREVEGLFARPEGTVIGEAQRDRLREFLARHPGEDLGVYGYLPALDRYLQRDIAGAAAVLDGFLATHDTVPFAEHAAMCGRVYLGVLATGAPDTEPALLARRAESCARLYPDAGMLVRILPRTAEKLEPAALASFRVGVARGLCAAGLTDADRDQVLAALYAAPAASPAPEARGAGAVVRPAIPMRLIRPGNADPGATDRARNATTIRESLTGNAAPQFDVLAVAQGPESFRLADLKGKVVLLDFTATWCGPCRSVIPDLVAMQAEHEGDLQVVAITRFYGYGNDFSEAGKGERRSGLERDEELRINRDFATHFGIRYPVVLVEQQVMSETFGVTGIPTLFVVGRDGNVVGHVVGAGEESHAKLKELIAGALAAK
ncbi:MAG: TlpA family protein disulfide reductase [Planctomycetes bacterium]|nr:TlpA family protein disulfide reductase [Planctomycetota bacterium]